jgi:glycosyltransferase involved in cell wall biosynthesis
LGDKSRFAHYVYRGCVLKSFGKLHLGFTIFNNLECLVVLSIFSADKSSDASAVKSDIYPENSSSTALVTILMCTFNGERFLSEQLDSIARQTHANWELIVSDDGSTDSTLQILEYYQETWARGRLKICEGPRRGFAANFMSVTCRAEKNSQYYAWADQDDVWHVDKLAVSVEALKKQSSAKPLLYSSHSEFINESGRVIGFSPKFSRRTSFSNALVESIGGGNTMVFNQATHQLIVAAGWHLDIVAHDWWAYLLVTGAGGVVCHDPSVTISYRQHDANLIGAKSTLGAKLRRLRGLFTNRFRSWNQRNITALESVSSKLTSENKLRLEQFKKVRGSNPVTRLLFLRRSGIYRQTRLGNLALFFAAVFRKI